MSIKTSLWVWALALCCFCFSSTARAGDWNNYDWGTDITYFKEQLLATGNLTLTDWQWFPGSGTYNNGDYSDDQFCFPMRNNDTGSYTIYYGMNGAQSCEWWGNNAAYSNATYVNYYDLNLGGVKIDCSNPLNDASCPGYQEAYTQLMCSTNPLYSQSCAGYAQAYFELQCSTNPLYDVGCSGYAAAYLAQQCTINQLYDQACPGYQEAYATKMAQEAATAQSSDVGTVDDGTVVVNDGSSVTAILEEAVASITESEPTIAEEAAQVVEETAQQVETAVETANVAEAQATGVATTPEAVVAEQTTKSAEVAVATETKKEETASTSSTPTESKDLSSMSPKEIAAALTKLGVLGNEQTNGVGDPTGLSGGLPGTDGAISATGQVAVGGQDASSSGGMGTDSSGASGDPSVTASNGGVPGQVGFGSVTNPSEQLANGSTALEQEMGMNVNDLFNNPAISGGASEYANTQTDKYERASERILRERIKEIVAEGKSDTNESVKEAEDLVAESVQESIENKMDELQTSDATQNQSEIVAMMGINIQFDAYKNQSIKEISFYGNEEWYKDVQLPQSRRALRNGLAQQILHDKMVDMQYPK